MNEDLLTIESAAYERGLVHGKIDARLADHDKHFEKINGSLEKLVAKIEDVLLTLAKLTTKEVVELDIKTVTRTKLGLWIAFSSILATILTTIVIKLLG